MTDNKGFESSESNSTLDSPKITPSTVIPLSKINSTEIHQTTENTKKIKCQVMKNVFLIGGSWILLFTAFQSVANLQSSLNSDGGLGTASLSTIYVALILSSILLPSTLIQKLGVKWTIVLSQCTYILYIAANMHPRYYTLIPAAVILGCMQTDFKYLYFLYFLIILHFFYIKVGAAPLWSAKCVFLTDLGTYYSKFTNNSVEGVINRFFGIFFAMFQSSKKPSIIIN